MAKNAADDLGYFIELNKIQESDLGPIRHWNNLKVAFEGGSIWLKGFTLKQIDSVEVKSIPFIKRYYAKEGKIFPLLSRLPERNIPSVLWTPIERGLRVELPKMNFNYFGIGEKVSIRLVSSTEEKQAEAMLVSIPTLMKYIETAPAVRLQKIQWLSLNDKEAFLLGRPLLPIQGAAYWRKADFYIPAGYDFDLPVLSEVLNDKINSDKNNWVVWNKNASYFLIEKNMLQPLSIASFRKSTIRKV